ncbi:MAG: hypothetical protein Q9169_002140 [Polycauliona sp. 2 TL-2023]
MAAPSSSTDPAQSLAEHPLPADIEQTRLTLLRLQSDSVAKWDAEVEQAVHSTKQWAHDMGRIDTVLKVKFWLEDEVNRNINSDAILEEEREKSVKAVNAVVTNIEDKIKQHRQLERKATQKSLTGEYKVGEKQDAA